MTVSIPGKSQAMDDFNDLRMLLGFDDENHLYVLQWVDGEKSIFQVKMTPQTFEALTADMVRVVKNYNLDQAMQYKEKQNESKKIDVDNTETKVDGLEGSSDKPANVEPESTC